MKRLSKRKIYRFCAADIAKGLFNGLIGNYLIYFFQPTVKSGIPNLLPDHRFLGYITVMSIITAVCKIVDAVTDPLVAGMSDRSTNPKGRRMPFLKRAGIPYALSVFLIFMAPFQAGSALNAVWVTVFLLFIMLPILFILFQEMPLFRKLFRMRVTVWAIMESVRRYLWDPVHLCMLRLYLLIF